MSDHEDIVEERDGPFILIVDDVAKNIQVLAHNLESAGYEFAAATNGKQALAMVQELNPDLILLDVMMPEMNGHEVCERLKESKDTRDIPVIFLTAKTETEDIVKGFELGAVDYVTKPFNSTELLARVKTHLDLKRGKDVIQKQSEERRELIHVMCHDLMNPLGAITSILDLIKLVPEKKEGSDDFIRKCAVHAMEIIELIRKLQALEIKKNALELTSWNVKESLNESLAMLEGRFSEKKVGIKVDVDPKLTVTAEKISLVNSVFNNILTNAVKFSSEGDSIDISASADGDVVEVAISDHGVGMPKKLLRDVFTVNKSTSRKGTAGEKGTGFGMPLVKKYMNAYGGDIAIESVAKTDDGPDDHGTTVRLRFKK